MTWAYQPYPVDDASPAQPQRAYWQSLPLIALGFFADDFDYRLKQTTIRPIATVAAAAAPQRAFYKSPRLWDEPEEFRAVTHSLRRTNYQTVGQSYRMWPKPPSAWTDSEPYEVRVFHPLRRTTFQTVGQSYRMWPRPPSMRAAFEIDEFSYKPIAYDYRRLSTAPTLQPLSRLPKLPYFDHWSEPHQVRIEYAASMFFNRTPGSITPDLTGGEWMIRARRRRGR